MLILLCLTCTNLSLLHASCSHHSATMIFSRKGEEDKVTLCGAPSSCNVFAFSGRNQAHNLTSIFHMNVLPFKHSDWSPGGVICQVASMLPISY